MDDTPTPPLVFANRVIRQFADHLLGPDLILEPRDYQILRLIFRKCGGSWEALSGGNIKQLMLVEKVLTNWGKMPGRKRQTEEDI